VEACHRIHMLHSTFFLISPGLLDPFSLLKSRSTGLEDSIERYSHMRMRISLETAAFASEPFLSVSLLFVFSNQTRS
jgi:hypothetical protein